MTRPSDVSQEAWDAASAVVGPPDGIGYAKVFTESIARAIMAETERCAKIADAHADGHEKAIGAYGAADKDAGRGRQEGHIDAGRAIAAAIRGDQP